MICFLDIDGVLANFVEGVNRAFGIKYDYATLPRPMEWDWFKNLGLTIQEVDSICTIDFWAGLRWMHDGREILEMVENKFQDIYLLTTCMSNPQSGTGKMLWIERHLKKYSKRVIITAAKSLLAGPDRVLIDDKNENVDTFEETGGRAILVARPWNRACYIDTLSQLRTIL